MGANVVGINGHQPSVLGEPRSELVSVLENLLNRARTGQLQSFIGCGFTATGERCAAWIDTHENVYEMLGSLAWLQHEYVNRHTEATG